MADRFDPGSDKITVEYRGPFRVTLWYFGERGKYYTEGEYTTQKLQVFDIIAEIKEMFKQGKRPGLVDGANEFYTVIQIPDHPHDHPTLILPEKAANNG